MSATHAAVEADERNAVIQQVAVEIRRMRAECCALRSLCQKSALLVLDVHLNLVAGEMSDLLDEFKP